MRTRRTPLFRPYLLARRTPTRTADIDLAGIEEVLDVVGIEFLDHPDGGAAVLGELIDVTPLHKPHADIEVAQAVSSSRLVVAVAF
jgi:hypothetical protein